MIASTIHSPQDGVTALMIAINYGSASKVLEVLFRAKPDVNVATYAKVHIKRVFFLTVCICRRIMEVYAQSLRVTQHFFMLVGKRISQVLILFSNLEQTLTCTLRYNTLCGSYCIITIEKL